MATPTPQIALQLRVELQEVRPVVWRRIIAPSAPRLDRFAEMLIAAMGWSNSHLHGFNVAGRRFGMRSDDWPDDELDEHSFTVIRALRGVSCFEFEYDFGDGWTHDVTIEATIESHIGLKYAVCLDGANACPPDDCGGPGGFERFLEALADPAHEEHEDYVRWNGGTTFERTSFDLATANAMLQKVSTRSRPRGDYE
jgi:Plasmid pRiA4b ORF-3-like protein